jgi:hypothetical protein
VSNYPCPCSWCAVIFFGALLAYGIALTVSLIRMNRAFDEAEAEIRKHPLWEPTSKSKGDGA